MHNYSLPLGMDRESLAIRMLKSKQYVREAKQILLSLMDVDESFDFDSGMKHYRCRKLGVRKRKVAELNPKDMTYTIRITEMSPTIVIREIKERK